MNQRQQSRGRGNAPRQAPAPQQQDREPTHNEQISRDQNAQARMKALFELIRQRRPEVEAVLPSDVPYLKFEAVVNMAIRREPRLLECYAPSFIKASIQAAYDGLLPDGNQAVILYSNNKVPGTGENGNKAVYRLEARYQSMVYGLRMKLVQAGAATFIDAIVVYKGEKFRYSRGLNPVLEHEPTLDPAKRKRELAIAAYAVATLPDGTKVFDVLTSADVMTAREVAKTKNVWDGPFWAEMWKKTAIRRLSKAIPTTRPVRDAEALEMFPQFSGAVPGMPALPAPPRPQRSDFQPAIEHSAELPLDLGSFEGGYDTEESRRATAAAASDAPEEGKPEPKKKAARAAPTPDQDEGREQSAENDGREAAETAENRGNEAGDQVSMPQDPEQWDSWADILIGGLEKLPSQDAVNGEHERQRAVIDAAPENVRRRVVAAMQERLEDLIAPANQGTLGIEGDGQ